MRRGALLFLLVPLVGLATAIVIWSGGAGPPGVPARRAGPVRPERAAAANFALARPHDDPGTVPAEAFAPAAGAGEGGRVPSAGTGEGDPGPLVLPAPADAGSLEDDAAARRAAAVLDAIFKGEVGLSLDKSRDRERRVAEAMGPLSSKSFFKTLVRHRSTAACLALDYALSQRLEALEPAARAAWEDALILALGDLATRPPAVERLAGAATWAVRDPARRERAAARVLSIAGRWDDGYWRRRAAEIAAELRRPPP